MIENGCGLSWWSPSFAFYCDDPIRIPLKSIFFILHDWFNQAKINEKEEGMAQKFTIMFMAILFIANLFIDCCP